MHHVSVRDFKPNYGTNLLAHIVHIIVITIVFFASIMLDIVKLRGKNRFLIESLKKMIKVNVIISICYDAFVRYGSIKSYVNSRGI